MASHYRLSAREVENAAPKRGQSRIKLQDGGGLALVARAKDRKFWVLRIAGREVGLGSAAGSYAVGLADARDRAYAIHKAVREGVGLAEAVQRVTGRKTALGGEAQPKAGGSTFKAVAEAYIKQQEPSWKSAVHARQWWSTLEIYVYPTIGQKPPGDVTTADVVAILKPIWNTYPETASRVRGRIEKIIAAWKVESGQQDKFNPATWAGHLQAVFPRKSKLKPVEHHAALPYSEVPKLMAELVERSKGARGGGIAALALKFLILTAGRTGEVLGARWSEVLTDGKNSPRWAIPRERMKMGKEHTVPLSDAAVAVLAEATRHRVDGNEAIFPGVTWQTDGVATLSNMALLVLLKRLRKPREDGGWALTTDVTAHGFRSSFRDWCADTGKDRELAEAALAHTVGGVEGAYRRTDMIERRATLMEQWAEYVCPKT